MKKRGKFFPTVIYFLIDKYRYNRNFIYFLTLLMFTIVLNGSFFKAKNFTKKSLNYPFSRKNMFFGLTILKTPMDYILAKELKVSWVSMQPIVIWWAHEPEVGRFRWNKLDFQIKMLQKLGLDCTPVLIPVNAFGEKRKLLVEKLRGKNPIAFLRSPQSAKLKLYPYGKKMVLWKNFLRRLVDRYDGDGKNDMPGLKYPVRYWHVVEEYPEKWIGSVKVYVNILKESYRTIKGEDPNAKVILIGLASNYARFFAYADGFIADEDAGVFSGRRYTRGEIARNRVFQREKLNFEYILREGKNYFDVADIHLYEEKLDFMDGKIEWLKSKMHSFGYEKPIWCIEGGGPFKISAAEVGTNPRHGDSYFGFYSDRENAEFVVKMHVKAARNGLERFHWGLASLPSGSYWDGPWHLMGLTTPQRKRKPSFFAFKMVRDYLNNFTKVEDLSGNIKGEKMSIYKFITPRGDVYVIWDDSEKWHSVDVSTINSLNGKKVSFISTVIKLDPYGNPIFSIRGSSDSKSVPISKTPIFLTVKK